MGIGVSYTGYDGKTRNTVVQGSAELPSFMGNTRRPQPKAAKAPKVGDVLKIGGMGDPVDGPLIGLEGNDSPQPDGQFRAVGSRGGWRLPFSRTEIEITPSLEMKCNKVTLTKLQYDVIFSEMGLAKGRTEERVVWQKSFFVLAEAEQGGGDGKYGVRMFSDAEDDDPVHPTPRAFAFGDEASLDTYDENSGKFLANYDRNGQVLEDPPVKVIEVKTCPGAVPSGGGNGSGA